MTKTAEYWIRKLNLEKHPEGGWFRETYCSKEIISNVDLTEGFTGPRNCSTSIYYLLQGNDFSAFHRIKSDEIWHYYTGTSAVDILTIENAKIRKQLCGNVLEKDQYLQVLAPRNTWFAARLANQKGFALVGCTVSPGFHFDDFELAGKELLEEYPDLSPELKKLIRF